MDLSKDDSHFNPGAAEYRCKLWVRVAGPDHFYYHVYWRRIAGALLVLGVAAWFTLAGAVWAFVKFQRGYDGARYFDLVFYPLRRTEYQTGLGRHYLTLGRAAWEKQNYREGYALLLGGLARVPQDVPGRRFLATAEAQVGRLDRALKTLIAGIDYARDDLDYLKLLFELLLEAQQDERLIALAKTLIPAAPDGVPVHQFIAQQSATAHYHRGRLAETARIVAAWRLDRTVEGQVLLAQCDHQQGMEAVAIARLERAVTLFPRRQEPLLELVRLHRELGHPNEARRYALLRSLRQPGSAGASIDLLHGYHASGDGAAEARELAEFLRSHDHDPSALVLLLWFAVDTAQPALAERVQALAKGQKLPANTFNLGVVQAHLTARDYPRALMLADAALREEQYASDISASPLQAMRAIAHFGLGDAARGQITLSAFLNNTRVRASDALLLARQLKAIGFAEQARRVLERASEIDPLNEPALAELIRLDAEAGNRAALAESLPKLFELRKHFRATLEETLRHLDEAADAPLRRQIQDALAQPVTL